MKNVFFNIGKIYLLLISLFIIMLIVSPSFASAGSPSPELTSIMDKMRDSFKEDSKNRQDTCAGAAVMIADNLMSDYGQDAADIKAFFKLIDDIISELLFKALKESYGEAIFEKIRGIVEKFGVGINLGDPSVRKEIMHKIALEGLKKEFEELVRKSLADAKGDETIYTKKTVDGCDLEVNINWPLKTYTKKGEDYTPVIFTVVGNCHCTPQSTGFQSKKMNLGYFFVKYVTYVRLGLNDEGEVEFFSGPQLRRDSEGKEIINPVIEAHCDNCDKHPALMCTNGKGKFVDELLKEPKMLALLGSAKVTFKTPSQTLLTAKFDDKGKLFEFDSKPVANSCTFICQSWKCALPAKPFVKTEGSSAVKVAVFNEIYFLDLSNYQPAKVLEKGKTYEAIVKADDATVSFPITFTISDSSGVLVTKTISNKETECADKTMCSASMTIPVNAQSQLILTAKGSEGRTSSANFNVV